MCLTMFTLYVVLLPSSAVTNNSTFVSSLSVKSYVPFPVIVADASFEIPVTVISSTSSSTSNVYSKVFGLNSGSKSPSLSNIFFNELSVLYARFTIIVYVLSSPDSLVALTLKTFLPFSIFTLPSPVIVVVSTSGIAWIIIEFIFDSTFIVYGPWSVFKYVLSNEYPLTLNSLM